jgi:hypothetical protein
VSDNCAFNLTDFDRYIEEHGIPEEDWPAAFAAWSAERTGGLVRGSRRWSGSHRRTGS